jgi:DNA-directed RNA polymerase specialized sigma24 family protein
MDDSVRNKLDNHSWEESITKLMGYAKLQIDLQKMKGRKFPVDRNIEDVVYEAIEKVYSEDRKWNPQEEPDLHRFLLSTVKSVIDNTVKLQDSKKRETVGDYDDFYLPTEDHTVENIDFIRLEQLIAEALKEDPLLCLVYKAVKDGLKPKEIAEEYNIDIKKVYSAKRQLCREVESIIRKMNL